MDTFFHIRMLMSIIMGLSIAQLLKNSVKLIDHPHGKKIYWVHLLWVFYVFLLLVHFWWFEIHLKGVATWIFSKYLFVIFYVVLYFVLCWLIFPDDITEYENFEAYFYSRKKWFFAFLALLFAADMLDTLVKGSEYWRNLHWEYPVRNIGHIVLCLVAIKAKSKKFHAALVVTLIVYELSWILRHYSAQKKRESISPKNSMQYLSLRHYIVWVNTI